MRLETKAPGIVGSSHLDPAADPAETFTALAERVVRFLTDRTPLSSWSVNRVEHDVQVHLHVDGDLIDKADEVEWEDSICRRVVEDGAGPVIPDLAEDPHLRDTQWPQRVRSYAGRPIVDADGELFGMLCGVDAQPLEAGAEVDVELLDLFCSLLSAQATLARQAAARSDREVLEQATTDARTGLLSAAAWQELLVGAVTRARAFGDLGALLQIQVTEAGAPVSSTRLREAASAVSDAAGGRESVTHLGDGVFASVLDDATPGSLAGAVRAHRETLQARDFGATIGWSLISPADGSPDAVVRRARASLAEQRRVGHDRVR